MKKIIIKNGCIGSGIKYIGWSGRGFADGGPVGAGPINCKAPSWDSYSQEIGINMVRMGFSIRHFLSEHKSNQCSILDQIKKGLENTDTAWAKSEGTSYSYAIQRCCDLGWKMLVCINPSYRSFWNPSLLNLSSDFLAVWRDFVFSLAKSIEANWPGIGPYFEITNEPDIGYFDGESFLPNYQGPSGGISPSQYSLLLRTACEGIREALPEAKILGPALASWKKEWIKEVLIQCGICLDGVSYHNVRGDLNDETVINEANSLLSKYAPQASDCIFNSEWAWWPDHDINNVKTALRVAQILYFQTIGNAHGSLYLGPAQPTKFKRGLGVIKFHPKDPNQVERTKTFFAFRLMTRGISGGKRLELINPYKKLKTLALLKDRNGLVITIINPSNKKFKNISLVIDENIKINKKHFLRLYQFDYYHHDSCQKSDYKILEKFNIEPESITQFIVPISS